MNRGKNKINHKKKNSVAISPPVVQHNWAHSIPNGQTCRLAQIHPRLPFERKAQHPTLYQPSSFLCVSVIQRLKNAVRAYVLHSSWKHFIHLILRCTLTRNVSFDSVTVSNRCSGCCSERSRIWPGQHETTRSVHSSG